jgi:hypothetical protein
MALYNFTLLHTNLSVPPFPSCQQESFGSRLFYVHSPVNMEVLDVVRSFS